MYKEPTDGSLASLTLANDSPDPLDVWLYAEAQECRGRASVGGVKSKSERKLSIRAEQHLSLTAIVGIDIPMATLGLVGGAIGMLASADSVANTLDAAGCRITVDFSPMAGQAYVLSMRSDGKTCTHALYEEKEDGKLAEIPFSKRQSIRANSEEGPWCKNM